MPPQLRCPGTGPGAGGKTNATSYILGCLLSAEIIEVMKVICHKKPTILVANNAKFKA